VPDPTPERKALDYVETELGVHQVHEQAQSSHKWLGELQHDLVDKRKRRRELDQYLLDREMVIAEEVATKHADQSQAARDRLLKVAINNDGDIRETRDELATLAWSIDKIEYAIERTNQDIKIAVARMHELQGLLQFMAVIKQAQQTRQHIESKGPWG
jgi:hypothetical protein